nr:unnamed protein product [Spirometra erinaceieuropaei]
MLTAVTNAKENSAGAKLRCLYTNAQILISKLDELKLCLAELSPDVLAVTETWMSGNISDNELALPGYQICRRDREHRQGGGTVVYVNEGLAVSDNTTKFACSTEAIWLTIKATSSPCLDVLTVYRPPRTDRIADTQLLEQLEKFSSRPNIMIMGDFNAPGTNCHTLQARNAGKFNYVNRWVKYVLSVTNFLFVMIGGILLVLGIIAFVESGVITQKSKICILHWIFNITVIVIIVGFITVLVSATGFIGSLRENQCLLKFYYISLAILFVCETIIGILFFVYRETAINHAEEIVKKTFVTQYREVGFEDSTNFMDFLQKEILFVES